MALPLPTPARFLPYGEARREPNIVVDGAPLPSTVLTLSHWPNNQSPPALSRDTSTATVFAYLDAPDFHQAVPYVTNNHFDEDGLFSLFAICEPATALAWRELLTDASFAGDFGVVRQRDAARLCFAIEALTDPATSTLPPAVFAAKDRVAALYRGLLAVLPDLLARLPAYRALWRAQDEHLAASEALVAAGTVGIQEVPELDLAIVRIPPGIAARGVRRYLTDEMAAVHPFAINTATERSRLLRVQGDCLEFEYRYEGWLGLATRRVALRVSLAGLADRLNAIETGPRHWVAEDPTGIVPRLRREDGAPSAIGFDRFFAALSDALTTAPVAWDPYNWVAPAEENPGATGSG